ncbi:MAG: hypothetical protein ABS49_10455 [Erythrobacter sp. SCN 62-14]|nr:MAG: hypothetical protein ABS49_10455 [Erythrobacter sp. SCN 62-14]
MSPAFSETQAICLALAAWRWRVMPMNWAKARFGLPFWRCWTIGPPFMRGSGKESRLFQWQFVACSAAFGQVSALFEMR